MANKIINIQHADFVHKVRHKPRRLDKTLLLINLADELPSAAISLVLHRNEISFQRRL